jgi:hypothetical protein
MLSTILQPEISSLESQVAQLQSQLAAAQQRITLLNEAESVADGAIQALQGAVMKVSALAPDAIANLKLAVLNLFQGDDNPGNGGGNNPEPEPQPDLSGGLAALPCALEDDKSEVLKGQAVEIACVLSDAPREAEYVELVPASHCVAYQRKHDGTIVCAYLGGNNKHRLKLWGEWLCVTHSVGSGFEMREAKRLTAYKHELKVWGMSLKQVERLAETDTSKNPPSRYHEASSPVEERLLEPEVAIAAALDPQVFQIGDRVEVTSDRHGENLVGQSGIVTAATEKGAAVNVNGTMRWFCIDEVTLVEASPQPRNAVNDLFPTAPTPTSTPAYNPYPMGRRGAAANWQAYQAVKVAEREQKLAASETELDF